MNQVLATLAAGLAWWVLSIPWRALRPRPDPAREAGE